MEVRSAVQREKHVWLASEAQSTPGAEKSRGGGGEGEAL